MTINKPNINNSACNTSKCVACNFRFVCASSPYCCVRSSSNVDNTEEVSNLAKKIEGLEGLIAGFVNSQVSVVSGILEEFKKIDSNINTINSSISETSNAISEKIESIQKIETIPENITEGQNQIVPFDKQDDKVLVEKKGMFGRTKWVEKKE